jgi:hypothetical protein
MPENDIALVKGAPGAAITMLCMLLVVDMKAQPV